MIDVSTEDLIRRLDEINMEKSLIDKFDFFYKRAISVPYVSAQEVFYDYFNSAPPFSVTGNKKSEFPDAFILKGITEYCKNNANSTVLVISNDTDWKRALENNKQIVQVAVETNGRSLVFGDVVVRVNSISKLTPKQIGIISAPTEVL